MHGGGVAELTVVHVKTASLETVMGPEMRGGRSALTICWLATSLVGAEAVTVPHGRLEVLNGYTVVAR